MLFPRDHSECTDHDGVFFESCISNEPDVIYIVLLSSYDGNGASPAVTHITCEGRESHLLSCNHRRDSTQLCSANSLAGIHCSK